MRVNTREPYVRLGIAVVVAAVLYFAAELLLDRIDPEVTDILPWIAMCLFLGYVFLWLPRRGRRGPP